MATYRPQRIAAFRALGTAILRGSRPGTPGIGDRIRALPRMIGAAVSGGYAQLGRGRLAMLLFALLYLVSPVDLVPEAVLGVFGLADDAVVAMWLAGALLVETDNFLEWERQRPRVVDAPPPIPDR